MSKTRVRLNLIMRVMTGESLPSYPPSGDSRLIYVSNSEGNDGTGAPTDIATVVDAQDPTGIIFPYKTISAALAQRRNGFPDHVLLKRGDTWNDESFGSVNIDGRSNTERQVIGYYGTTGDRPVISPTATANCMDFNGNSNSHLTLWGLDLYSRERDPDNAAYYVQTQQGGTGLRFTGTGSNITIDDCKIRFFRHNIVTQGYDGVGLPYLYNVLLRRCIITDAYSAEAISHSQGMYATYVDGLTISQCFSDKNGYNADVSDAVKTQFNHNSYYSDDNIAGSFTVTDSIYMRGSSHGCYMRCGGTGTSILTVGNAINFEFGYKDGREFKPGARGDAIRVVSQAGVWQDQTPATATEAVWGMGIDQDALDSGGIASFTECIVSKLPTASLSSQSIQGLFVPSPFPAELTLTDVHVYDWGAADTTFDPTWIDPDRTIETYMTSIGEAASLDAFANLHRNRGLGEWTTAHSAISVTDYILAGFNL